MTLQNKHSKICDTYAKAFAQKHDLQFNGWIADDAGTIASMSDYLINFHEIKYDIDNNISEEKYIKYYDECVEHSFLESARKDLIRELENAKLHTFPNYDNWLRGCPHPTPEEINRLRKAVEKARKLLEVEIENYKQR